MAQVGSGHRQEDQEGGVRASHLYMTYVYNYVTVCDVLP